MPSNQSEINEAFKDRDLLITLKGLILDLVSIEEDMAILDVSNKGRSIARVKKVLLQHGKNVKDFKLKIDQIRKDTINERGTKSIH